jgi:PP-loop superfamily ATP-utilizing enzyme
MDTEIPNSSQQHFVISSHETHFFKMQTTPCFFCRRRMHGMLHLQISEAGGSFSCLVDGTYSELPVL